ncbi:MAG: PaaI family thioesterase [Planktomarina sp.]
MTKDTLSLTKKFLDVLPHANQLQLSATDSAEGHVEISMPYADALIGDVQTGVIHGGAVSALMDTACGAAVVAHPDAGLGTATLDLRIDYMRGATPGQAIRAVADCHHVTRTVAFVRAVAYDDDEKRPVAMATGAFTVPQKKLSL